MWKKAIVTSKELRTSQELPQTSCIIVFDTSSASFSRHEASQDNPKKNENVVNFVRLSKLMRNLLP